MAQVIEGLQALSSNPSTHKKKKEEPYSCGKQKINDGRRRARIFAFLRQERTKLIYIVKQKEIKEKMHKLRERLRV